MARQLIAQRTKVLALQESALRGRLLAPRPVRSRIEVRVPPVGEVRPSAMGWGDTSPEQPQPPAPRVALWAAPDSMSAGSPEVEPVVVPAQASYARESVAGGAFTRTRATAERLPAAVQDRLRPTLGHEVADVVVHTGEGPSALARGRGADAVTVGTDVYWADCPPATDHAGDADLLRHEVWHAVQSTRPGTSWRRSTPAGRAAEERQAGAYAQAVDLPTGLSPTVAYRGAPVGNLPAPTRPQPAAETTTGPYGVPPAAAPAQQAMPGVRDPQPPALPEQAMHPPRAVSAEATYQEVLRQLRRDRERGA
ncbi:eCIS core domain-containing protein [Kribbella sp. NPDC055110]